MNDNAVILQPNPMVHVRFDGRSWDLDMSALDLGDQSTDAQIRAAVAGSLDVPAQKLASYTVEREAGGNVTLRPQAVFGK